MKRPQQFLIQTRTKRSGSGGNNNNKDKKAAISRAINQKSSSDASSIPEEAMIEGIYGLRPVDYSILPPIRRTPPPPPLKPGFQKYLWPLTLVIGAATFGYFYVNNKNDNYEYWRAMQTGEAVQFGDDDEYEDDDEDDEDDVEE